MTDREFRAILIGRQQAKCFYCQCRIKLDTSTIDHVVPVSRGGKDHFSNKVAACSHCNFSKGSRTLDEWIEHLMIAKRKIALELKIGHRH